MGYYITNMGGDQSKMDPRCQAIYEEHERCYDEWIETHFKRKNLAPDPRCDQLLQDFHFCLTENIRKVTTLYLKSNMAFVFCMVLYCFAD